MGELTGVAAGYEPEAITPVIQPLYRDLWQRLACAGVTAAGPALAYCQDAPTDDGAITIHAAVPVIAGTGGERGFALCSWPKLTARQPSLSRLDDDVLSTGQALARWIDANGYRSAGYVREVTLEWSADPGQWVTELQQPIYATGG